MPSKSTYLVHPCGEQDGCEGARVRLGGRLGLQISVIWDFQKADESQRYLGLQSCNAYICSPLFGTSCFNETSREQEQNIET